MSRMKPSNLQSESTLEELIPLYAEHKFEMDSYKAMCDNENTAIKSLMFNAGVKTYCVGKYKANRSVSVRETLDEEELLIVCKKFGVTDAIKTKEYVDMVVLEKYLYDNEPDDKLLTAIDRCRSQKEVVTLKITTAKEDK